jgi:hypothetical protein
MRFYDSGNSLSYVMHPFNLQASRKPSSMRYLRDPKGTGDSRRYPPIIRQQILFCVLPSRVRPVNFPKGFRPTYEAVRDTHEFCENE